MGSIRTAVIAATLLLAGTGLCAAQGYGGATQPPPTSRYPDGTGNVAVDDLNAGQLDQNYRGPWHQVPADRVRPGYAPPAYAPSAYAPPAYAPPAYPQAAYAPGAYPQGTYAPGGYAQGGYPSGAYAQPAYPPSPVPGGY